MGYQGLAVQHQVIKDIVGFISNAGCVPFGVSSFESPGISRSPLHHIPVEHRGKADMLLLSCADSRRAWSSLTQIAGQDDLCRA